ncbi:MAG: hypothetical protein K2Y05_02445 [Hyphomicrobiaceae bacterium]|nr:hypothetical protein [Hyphomicrobiaceae bacterium]
MPNNISQIPNANAPDKELALWMLERMRDSKEFLNVIRAARSAGGSDILDTSEYVALHKGRLAPLYQGAREDKVELSEEAAAAVAKLTARDLLSGNEELLEQALAAYIATHAKADEGLAKDWETTFDLARDEIEGRTNGAFKPGFTADLATAARSELARRVGLDKGHGAERGGRE